MIFASYAPYLFTLDCVEYMIHVVREGEFTVAVLQNNLTEKKHYSLLDEQGKAVFAVWRIEALYNLSDLNHKPRVFAFQELQVGQYA